MYSSKAGERGKQIAYIKEQFIKWLRSEAMRALIYLFDDHISDADCIAGENDVEFIFSLRSNISPIWDFRRMQKEATTSDGEAARWLLKNTEFVEEHRKEIMSAAELLGLVLESDSVFDKVDYILPLGGARMSNLYRPQLARKMAEKIDVKSGIVALSTCRPISESERDGYVDTYAPNAETEFDAISRGMVETFDLDGEYSDIIVQKANPYLTSNVRQYRQKYKNCPLYTVAAPSTDGQRRANSADCFEFFFNHFNVEKGAKILNCTSQIYVPYQQVRALKYAIKYDVEFDTVGYADKSVNKVSFEPVNYLQEIKGTIDAMCAFINEFSDYKVV